VTIQEADFPGVVGPRPPSDRNRDRIGRKATFSSGVLQETEK